jgi:1-acyl-sn-glycerol-3-phosphate acyltransferase
VVPVAILGSHRVRNWKRLRFPKIVVRYGKAIRFEQITDPSREEQQACADEILRRIRVMHGELEQAGHRDVVGVARRSVHSERNRAL